MNHTLRLITKYNLRRDIALINQRNYFYRQIYQNSTQATTLKQTIEVQSHLKSTSIPKDLLVSQVEDKLKRLLDEASLGNVEESGLTFLKEVFKHKQQLKANNILPTVSIYEMELSAYTKLNDSQKMVYLLEEMDMEGVKPSRVFYHKYLYFAAKTGDSVLQAKILERMEAEGIYKTVKTYGFMILCMRNNLELERALDTIEAMEKLQLIPSLNSYLVVIDLCILANEPSLAYNMLKKAEETYELTERQNHYYMGILRCAVLSDDLKVVQENWNMVVKEKKMKPDLGLCNYAIVAAAKLDDPHFAYDILHTIHELGYPYSDHHFCCLLESFASTLDMKNTFLVFNAMRKAGITPTKATSSSVLQKLGNDMNAIFRAREALKSVENVDIVAFNLVIHAFAYNGNFDEAMSTFAMAQELNITPDIDTLHSLLDACVHARNVDHGVSIYQLFEKRGIQPTTATLSKMIVLMCTQESYEDAFVYLEKIKESGDIPLRGAYYRLIKKLAASNDPRIDMAIEDMKACGYSLSPYLKEYMDDKEQLKEKRARKREFLGQSTAP
ncbi:unnamed protein product [Cunninghamella echinulata]